MKPDKRERLLGTAMAALWLSGCAVQRDDAATGAGGGIDTARQWQCEEDDTTIVCQGAIAAEGDEPDAYTCETDDPSVACPPADALGVIAEDLEALDLDDTFAAIPWACLRTGAVERHCMKDLVAATPDVPEPPDGAPDDAPDDAPDAPDSTTQPGIPDDCAPESWEPYFCALATASYRDNGVDIEFPCDIFDANADFGSTFDEVPTGGGDPGLPSCHDGEWKMRNQSWLDAVGQGCVDLNEPILTMCQQAANYAPSSGACTATGTW